MACVGHHQNRAAGFDDELLGQLAGHDLGGVPIVLAKDREIVMPGCPGHMMQDFVVAAPVDIEPLRVWKPRHCRLELLPARVRRAPVAFGRPHSHDTHLIGVGALGENPGESGIATLRQMNRQSQPFGGSGAGV
jgi:hypothetical protein